MNDQVSAERAVFYEANYRPDPASSMQLQDSQSASTPSPSQETWDNLSSVIVPFWKTNAYIALSGVPRPGYLYLQLISLPIKVMKHSAAAFISTAWLQLTSDEGTTGFQHRTEGFIKKLVAPLTGSHISSDN